MKWLHISDLHHSPSPNFDTHQLRKALREYIKRKEIIVDQIFFTGDFRFAKAPSQLSFKEYAQELREIAELAGITDPNQIHIVPGNHDLDRCEKDQKNTPLIEDICERYNDGEFRDSRLLEGVSSREYLLKRFGPFWEFSKALDNPIWSEVKESSKKPFHFCRAYGNYKIAYLNTAIACERDDLHTKLVIGYEDLFQALKDTDPKLPGIALGHHSLTSLDPTEFNKIGDLFKEYNIKLYLCGDRHLGDDTMINGILQITAGCLTQTHGVEPVFYVGDWRAEGNEIIIDAYSYDNNRSPPRWGHSETLTDSIREKLPSVPTVRIYKDDKGHTIFGRNEEIETIEGCLSKPASMIVEVSGVGGVGKTTICNAVVKSIGACVSVNVREHKTTYAIQKQILKEIGFEFDENNDTIKQEEYAAKLLELVQGNQKKLLYLDNLETLIENSAENKTDFRDWIKSFLRKSGWNVLYSTQRPIDFVVGKAFEISPLQENSAFEMFKSRWKKPLSDENEKIAREIVRELSGLPLAIELVTSPAQQRDYEIGKLVNVVKSYRKEFGYVDEPEENTHRSMSAALRLAREAAEKKSNKALLMWSIFAMYPLDFSEELFDLGFSGDSEFEKARKALRSYSLIDKYKMLGPVRAVAIGDGREKANFSVDLLAEAFALLCDTLSRMFKKANDWKEKDSSKWHVVAIENLPGTLSLMANAVLRKVFPFDDLNRLFRSATNYFSFSSQESLETLRKLKPLFLEKGDHLDLANVLQSKGDLESRLSQIEEAQKHYAEAEKLYREERSNLGLANVLQSKGDLESLLGQIEEAQKHYAEAEKLYREVRYPFGLADVFRSKGDLESRLGQNEEAQKHYTEAEKLYREVRYPFGLAKLLRSMGDLERSQGQNEEAQKHYAEAEKLYGSIKKEH
jgi:tetratricopeptide (TPR) repeat protein